VHLPKPREIAVEVLSPGPAGQEYVENRLEKALLENRLSAPDRRLVQELVYGVVRAQSTLDWLIDRKTAGRQQKPLLRTLLQLGLYQMFWLDRVPGYAAVNETVELAKKRGFGPQAGFINAVLRGYGREREQTIALLESLKKDQPALGYSHPQWLYDKWLPRFGADKVVQLMDWNNTPPPTYARLNILRGNVGDLMAHWQTEHVEHLPKMCDWLDTGTVFELKNHPSLATLPSFQKGLFYLQDPSTLLAVASLAPQPGETILDACAAPGGKTAFIAQCMKNQGRLVAEDMDTMRLKLVEENCTRLGVTCATIRPSTLTTPSGELFDRILVDAPCSNTGVMRRRVDLRWRLRPEEIARLSRCQSGILRQCAGQLKPGGTLVYSTCSLEPEENQEVVGAFLEENPDFTLAAERGLAPFTDGVDGAYTARLCRNK
jgi:16S rRNA (cytosine967-C5)-methyltransferase